MAWAGWLGGLGGWGRETTWKENQRKKYNTTRTQGSRGKESWENRKNSNKVIIIHKNKFTVITSTSNKLDCFPLEFVYSVDLYKSSSSSSSTSTTASSAEPHCHNSIIHEISVSQLSWKAQQRAWARHLCMFNAFNWDRYVIFNDISSTAIQ